MAGERKLTVVLAGDASHLKTAFKEGENASEGFGSKLGKLASPFGSIAKIASGFVIGEGLLKLPGFFTGAAQAAADDEAESGRLDLTLQKLADSGSEAALTYDDMKEATGRLIDKGQKLAFSDSEIRDSLGKLVDSTGDYDQATVRLAAAQDLARGRNIPLADATKLLGKLSDENVQIFKKMGITMADNATEADVLATVQAKFGGQADKYAKSTAGQFAQAKIAMSEIVEGIGYGVLPILTAVGTKLAANLPAIQEFVGELGEKASAVIVPALEAVEQVLMQGVIPAALGIADVFRAIAPYVQSVALHMMELAGAVADKLAGPFMAVFGFLSDHKDDLKIFGAALLVAVPVVWAIAAAHAAQATAATAAAVAEGLALLPIIAISVAVGALAVGVYELVQHWDDLTARYPILQTATDNVKAGFLAFTGWITGTFVPVVEGIGTAVTDAAGVAIGFVRDHWGEIQAVIEPIMLAVKTLVTGAFDAIKLYVQTWFGIFKGIVTTAMALFQGDWEGAWNGIKQIVQSVWDGIKGIIDIAFTAINTLTGGRLGELTTSISEKLTAIKNLFQPVWDAIELVIKGVWTQIQTDIQAAWTIIEGVFNIIKGVVTGDFAGAWTGLQQVVGGVWTGITSSIQNAWTTISGILDIATGGAFSTLIEGVKGAFAGVGTAVSTVFDGIPVVIKGAINSVISAVNSFIGALNSIQIHIPAVGVGRARTPSFDWGGLGLPPIPYLARGGVVIAGDNPSGIEAIVPLERAREFGFSGGAQAEPVVINIYNPIVSSAAALLRMLDLELKRAGRPGLLANG